MRRRTSTRLYARYGISFGTILTLGLFAWGIQAQERFRKSPPLPGRAEEILLPPIQTGTLSNRLTVAVIPRPDSPFIHLQVILGVGASDSPERLQGLATMTARMVSRGSRTISGEALVEMIDSIGGEFFIDVTMDYTVLSLDFLAEYLDTALTILQTMVSEAAFMVREIDSTKRDLYYDIVAESHDPEFVARKQLYRFLFTSHPYQRALYSEDRLRFIDQKEMIEFYSQFYRPNNCVFVAHGNIDFDRATSKISRYFNTWTPQEIDRTPSSPLSINEKEKVCFIELPGMEDALIYVGNLVMPLTSPDYFPFLVLGHVLGGTTGSRLFMNLRESKGYAFSAFSEAEFFRSCGVFWAKAFVTAKDVYPAVQEIKRELQTLSREEADPLEIEEAKSHLIGNLPLRFESADDYSRWISRYIALNLGEAHWTRARENLMLVDAQKTLEVARKYFRPEPLVIIVGDKSNLPDEELSRFGEVDVYDNKGVLLRKIIKEGE